MAGLEEGFSHILHSPKENGDSEGQGVDTRGHRGTSMTLFLNICSFYRQLKWKH